MSNAWEHFKTITKHRTAVMINCFRAGIPLQGLTHDLSKYSPEEFLLGVKYYQGTMHHKGRNKHHFEYWTDYDPVTRKMSPVKMPLKYVKEMFCDRVAASKIYMKENYNDGSALAYFMRAKATRSIHPETSELIEKLLVMLKNKGERKTFEYIRRLNKY